MFKQMRAGKQGYSIVEMSIALVVLGLIIGGALIPLQTQLENAQIKKTEAYLQEAKAAVMAYALQNKTGKHKITYYDNEPRDIPAGRPYLPCPDIDNDGIEDRQAVADALGVAVPSANLTVVGACTRQKGLIPWKTLGIQDTDVWGSRLVYAVDLSFSNQLFGMDETFRADVFDRRLALTDGNYALRQSAHDVGIIVCSSYYITNGGGIRDGCPNNTLNNILAGVVVMTATNLPQRRIPPFTAYADSVVGGVAQGAAFVILSHGKNAKWSISRDGNCRSVDSRREGSDDTWTVFNVVEEANAYYAPDSSSRTSPLRAICPDRPIFGVRFRENLFVQTPISDSTGDGLDRPDDMLIWVGGNELMGYLLRSGAFPIDHLEFLPE